MNIIYKTLIKDRDQLPTIGHKNLIFEYKTAESGTTRRKYTTACAIPRVVSRFGTPVSVRWCLYRYTGADTEPPHTDDFGSNLLRVNPLKRRFGHVATR